MSHAHPEQIVTGLLDFIDASPTPYHAVASTAVLLERAGFTRLQEAEPWSLRAGMRAYVTRAGSSVCAFIVGDRPPHEAGFQLIGAHTDSPNLRVKPQPDVRAHGYHQLAVEIYGGVLWHTWLDRDLSIAGRVVIDDGTPAGNTRLLDFGRPLLRIPNLAIHLQRTVNSEGLKLNAQTHMVPVLALADPQSKAGLSWSDALAAELSRGGSRVEPGSIVGWDLCLYDTQRSAVIGLDREFIAAPRLDNLASCYAALAALTTSGKERPETRAIVLYDHEEVGSHSAQGAASPFLLDVLARICNSTSGGDPDPLPRAIARSLMISADMAHGVHPNYADRHEPGHQPVLGRGPVLKTNVSQAYASDAETSAKFQLLCRAADVKLQHFVSRSDLACGSTIGPISASRLGLRTVDVGNPLLSMHSIREMAAAADVMAMQKVLDTFLR
jgi:aspartyl aminopeptidase